MLLSLHSSKMLPYSTAYIFSRVSFVHSQSTSVTDDSLWRECAMQNLQCALKIKSQDKTMSYQR